MSTYEVNVSNVIFILDAEDDGDAASQVEEMLQEIAHDWGSIRVED